MTHRDKIIQSLRKQIHSISHLTQAIQNTSTLDNKRKDNFEKLMHTYQEEMEYIQLIINNLLLNTDLFEERQLNHLDKISNKEYNQTQSWKTRAEQFKDYHRYTCQLCGQREGDRIKIPTYPDREWVLQIELHHTNYYLTHNWKTPEPGLERTQHLLVLCNKCHATIHNKPWPDLQTDNYQLLNEKGLTKKYRHRDYESQLIHRGRR